MQSNIGSAGGGGGFSLKQITGDQPLFL